MTCLKVVMYHYVRDLPHTRFPRIKGMMLDDFRRQVRELSDRYEMASLESALAFLCGEFTPSRDLCLLTFDDGLKEHFSEVTPFLSDSGVQGVFFVVTSCLEEGRVIPAHMNHFLMASLEFRDYRNQLWSLLSSKTEGLERHIDEHRSIAARTYPWDTPDVAEFKYGLNFLLDPAVRDEAVRQLFKENLGDEQEFARDLYFSWQEGQQMQSAGMMIGGHTDSHRPIAAMSSTEMGADLERCRRLLDGRLMTQERWPFSYPYGKSDSYTDEAVFMLKGLRFDCSFSTETGDNGPTTDLFRIRRVDCKQAF